MTDAPRKKRPARCKVCTCLLGVVDTVVMPYVGRVHEDCAQELERAIEDGGCNRHEYLRQFAERMAA